MLGRGFTAPSDLLNVAAVGVGGQGRVNLVNLASENVVALCDVDWDYANKGFAALDADIQSQQERLDRTTPRVDAQGRPEAPLTPVDRERIPINIARMKRLKDEHLPRAARYQDYRQMLDRQKDIDAVVDRHARSHARDDRARRDGSRQARLRAEAADLVGRRSAAARAQGEEHARRDADGQPGTLLGRCADRRRVRVGRRDRRRARGPRVDEPAARLLAAGDSASGDAQRCRPADSAGTDPGLDARLATAMAGNYPKPEGLAWDLFLGVAPYVEYHPVYHPFNWRGWVDWGCGAIGDMGAHLMDHSMWALDLGYPTTIETLATPFNGASFPNATMTVYEFPARDGKPPVKLTWYDGGLKPPKPVELGEGQELSAMGGALLVGSKGKLLHDTYGKNPRLLPDSLHSSFGKPALKLARIPFENHEMNWVDAAKGKTAASCPFEYAARLTEVMLLGVVALKAGTEDRVRRRKHAGHQRDGRQPVSRARAAPRLVALRARPAP